jgi:hypothetical protein
MLRIRLAGLFVFVTIGFALYRQSAFFIWDDSPGAFNSEWAQGPPLGELLAGAFASTNPNGYRPLATIHYAIGLRFLYELHGPTFVHLLGIGSVYGALALCLFGVARRFLRHEATAYFTVLLVLASPPLAATTWVVLAGLQAIVPLLTCLALLCYWRGLEPGGRWFFRGCLGLIFLVGPWYREFLGIVPILIGFLEWQRARRPTPLLVLAAAGLLHAIYPMALPKLLFFPELPLQPVFALGHLSLALEGGGIRWRAAAHFLPLFPPLLLLLGGLSGLAGAWERIRALLLARHSPNSQDLGPGGWHALVPALAFACWLSVVLLLLMSGRGSWLLPLAVSLGVAVIGLQQDLLLPFWFLAAFLPILRVFTEHVHFLYTVVPAAIILAGATETLWLRLGQLGGWWKGVRPCVAACLGLVAADQAANPYGVYRVNHATYEGIQEVAHWLKLHVPAGSAIVSNVIHGEEIKWHSGGHVENFWTVSAGVFDPARVLAEPARLDALLAQSAGKNVYYLDVDFDYLPSKVGYHRHKYIHHLKMPREDLGVLHRTAVRYVFFDPLRHLIPRDFVPFLGAPDLVNDFYSGRSGHHCPFTYKVSARYHLYRATTKSQGKIGGAAD